jgi:hypothetical protein
MQVRVRVIAHAAHIGAVYNALSNVAISDRSEEFTADGSLRLEVSVVEADAEAIAVRIRDATSGAATTDILPT